MIAIGVDIVEVSRIESLINDKGAVFLNKVFAEGFSNFQNFQLIIRESSFDLFKSRPFCLWQMKETCE